MSASKKALPQRNFFFFEFRVPIEEEGALVTNHRNPSSDKKKPCHCNVVT